MIEFFIKLTEFYHINILSPRINNKKIYYI
jgi:hypothetical protein